MALRITFDCIACGACQYACPNDAVVGGVRLYSIIARRCNECVGQFETPQCVAACPIDCIVVRPLTAA
jgi:Na+-translocating ferredoxin:NAD+ oxidoreductase RNF subunit RnfB